MKKLTLLATVGATLLLTACGTSETTTPSDGTPEVTIQQHQEENPIVTWERALANLFAWMKEGTFSYDFSIIEAGEAVEGTFSYNKGNYALTSMSAEGNIRIVFTEIEGNPRMTMIEETQKMIFDVPVGQLDVISGMGLMTSFDESTKLGEGQGEVLGEMLPYEEYMMDDVATRYYLKNGQVYAIENTYETETSLMVLRNVEKSVRTSLFEIPTEWYQTFSY